MEAKQLITIRGTVYYWISRAQNSKARCIMFTHGLTADHTMFEKQVEYYQKHYTVITWDVPLHGRSYPYSHFSYENCALDMLEILDREQIHKTVLLGMSMGGYPSQEFAARFPERVDGFIALDTTPYGLGYYSKSDIWWLSRTACIAKCFPEDLLRKSMARSVSKTSYSYGRMTEMLSRLTKDRIISQMDIGYSGFLKENRDITLKMPVLILLGQFDKTGKVSNYCKAWAEKEGFPLHIIENAAHFSNGDNPQKVNLEIEEFIKQLDTVKGKNKEQCN
ncbi:MAG: alpha/beta hydrolase [Clostridiaceae bacterium]|nr:alpha/beta hydrolase [Clostridiaceae bacterium]